MTWVKICGTTNIEDALVAVEAGADAVGFVFYENSPRNIAPQTARDIVVKLPETAEKVGVFVGESAKYIDSIASEVGLTAAQIYCRKASRLDEDWIRRPRDYKVIQAIPADQLADGGVFISDDAKEMLHAILVDSGSPTRPGGTGEAFDWENCYGMIHRLSVMQPLIVAGGLKPENVGEAVRRFHPWGVDVASGVETMPGKKDPGKVRAFVRAVREIDEKTT